MAQIDLRRESGMGRVAWYWREAFLERGYEFEHIGASEVGPVHPGIFPLAAYRRYRQLEGPISAVLVHEPSGLPFIFGRPPVIAFSHGLERRGWQAALKLSADGEVRIRARSRLLFPVWRLRQADATLRHADGVLVLNSDDLAETKARYRRRSEDVLAFRNGVYLTPRPRTSLGQQASLLFVGSWMPRKGVSTLIKAVGLLRDRGSIPQIMVAGAGDVLSHWPPELRSQVRLAPAFGVEEELALFDPLPIFLLPSLFEGQPLALLQAMAAGCCCIASDISGVRDLITAGQSGLLHPPQNADVLADLIQECLEKPSLRQSLGEAAQRAVADRAWPVVASEVVDFVEGVIGRRRALSSGGGNS